MQLLNRRTVFIIALLFCCVATHAQRKKAIRRRVVANTEAVSQADDADKPIKNGIQLQSNGLKVSEAFLVFDDQNPVPENNKVKLNQNVNMVLVIDTGWQAVNGRVFPGSKQTVKLSSGEELQMTDELFAAFDETGVPEDDAHFITLNTSITALKSNQHYAIVHFKLWDKKSNSQLSGSYKLYVSNQ